MGYGFFFARQSSFWVLTVVWIRDK
jgi:hypothetical protein